jgi:hypothetical protein
VIRAWIRHHVEPGSLITSDGLSCFSEVAAQGLDHQAVVTKGDRDVLNTTFYWTSTVLANLKTSLLGVYHQANRKDVPRFFALFQYRFNPESAVAPPRVRKTPSDPIDYLGVRSQQVASREGPDGADET